MSIVFCKWGTKGTAEFRHLVLKTSRLLRRRRRRANQEKPNLLLLRKGGFHWQSFILRDEVFVRRTLRMDLSSFNKLVGLLLPDLAYKREGCVTQGVPLTPHLHVFATIRWLAGASYLDLSIYRSIWTTIAAILKSSSPELNNIHFPKKDTTPRANRERTIWIRSHWRCSIWYPFSLETGRKWRTMTTTIILQASAAFVSKWHLA